VLRGRRLLELEFGDSDDFDNSRLEWRRLFSELLGTFFLVLVAAGGGILHGQGQISLAAAVVAPGLMVMAIILFMGAVSGPHLNPGVSLAFALRGDFPRTRVPGYIIVQLLGATLAGPFLDAVFGNIQHLGAAAWIRERGRHWLSTWLSLTDDDEYGAFMVLTACRMWQFDVEEVHACKEAAARWALARNPWRLDRPGEPGKAGSLDDVASSADGRLRCFEVRRGHRDDLSGWARSLPRRRPSGIVRGGLYRTRFGRQRMTPCSLISQSCGATVSLMCGQRFTGSVLSI
jgi:hypothetical protein